MDAARAILRARLMETRATLGLDSSNLPRVTTDGGLARPTSKHTPIAVSHICGKR